MAPSPLSQSIYLRVISGVLSVLPLGFGINALLRPANALAFFEFDRPVSAIDQKLVDNLLLLYGARDVFMAAAMFATAYYGHRKALGWILISLSGVAGMDGIIVRDQIGRGEWTHWGYAPVLATLGAVLLGVLDG